MEMIEPTKAGKARRNRVEGTRRNVTYQRYNKPPYSYLGMIAMAIHTAPDRRLTLGGVHTALKEMFPFFNERYSGWKDSVRHNLSHNPCFYKVIRHPKNTLHPKGNYWKVDLTKVPKDVFKRQTSKSVCPHSWAKTLHEQISLPAIDLDSVPDSDLALTSSSSEEHCETKKGVKNFKIDTILKKEVKEEESYLTTKTENADDTRRVLVSEQEFHMTPYLLPGVVFRDNPHLVALLTETARQCHGNQIAAIENLRNLCPPANYGTPQSLHRTWTTQPTSPQECYHGFPSLMLTDVKTDHAPAPMDLSASEMVDSACYAFHQNQPFIVQFGPNEAVTHHASANSVQHGAVNFMRGQAQVFGCPSYSSGLESRVSCDYYNKPFIHQVPSTPTMSHISTFSPRRTPPYHSMPSPMSVVSLEDSRSSFSSATSHSRMSSVEAPSVGEPSPVSSSGSLQDMISDTSSQMSNDVYVCHGPNGMFMRSVENSSGNDVSPESPSVLRTENIDMLASWDLS